LYLNNAKHDYLSVKGEKITQVRSKCDFCKEILNAKAAEAYLKKREEDKPLYELQRYKVLKVNKKYSLLLDFDMLLSLQDENTIRDYLITTINPPKKLNKEFSMILDRKFNGISR
jgi:hypothetical protein